MLNAVAVTTAGKDLISFDQKKLAIIRNMVASNLTPDEFDFFISVSKARGLDPVLNQIHAVKRKVKVSKNPDKFEERMTIQVGIDGFRLIAARTNEYAGCDKTLFEYNAAQEVVAAEVTVYRLVQGQRCAFSAIADWDEFFPGESQGFMWKSKPKTMLGKCAEAQALRKAFPNDLAGIYEPAEIQEKEVIAAESESKEENNNNDFDDQRRQMVEGLFEKFRKLGVPVQSLMTKLEKPPAFDALQISDEEIEVLKSWGAIMVKNKIPAREMFPVVNHANKGVF